MKLAEPLNIRGRTLKNRTFMLSMGFPGLTGEIAINYFVARARGGVGCITTGLIRDWSILLDKFEKLRPLTEAVHEAAPDCLIGAQIMPGVDRKGKPLSPSGSIHPATHIALVNSLNSRIEIPQPEYAAMSRDDIKYHIENMVQASNNAVSMGYDYIELHATHAYLFRQFLSPLDNCRSDEYGGSIENRMRFPLETVRALRSALGHTVPIFIRIAALETGDGGITIDESARFAVELEKAGVDVIIVSQGALNHPRGYMQTVCPIYNYLTMGSFVEYAALIKRYVNIPVTAVGRINKPELAETILNEGKADIIGLGRQMIADPDWPKKAISGAWETIRPCLSCNACIDPTTDLWLAAPKEKSSAPLPCAVNAQSCREGINEVKTAQNQKKVMVVGSGPAGMEAARIASMRGHKVTLYEKGSILGGNLVIGSKPPMKESIEDLRKYLTTELEKTGVRIVVGQVVDMNTIDKEKADVLVIATGSRLKRLNIPGINGKNVVTANDVLMEKVTVGKRVMIIGGGLVGLETAEFLSEQGKAVFVAEMLAEAATDIYPTLRYGIVQKAKEAGVIIYTSTKAVAIKKNGVEVDIAGKQEFIKVDTVISAVGGEPDKSLADSLKGKLTELYVIGDCDSVGMIRNAIHEGHRVGRTV